MPSTASNTSHDSSNIGGVALVVYLLVVYIAFQLMDSIGYQSRATGAVAIGAGVIAWGIGIVGLVHGRKWGVFVTLTLAVLTMLVLLAGGEIWLTVVLVLGVLAVVTGTDQSAAIGDRLG